MAFTKEEKRWTSTPLTSGVLDVSLAVNLYLFIIVLLHDIIFKISIISDTKENILFTIVIITEIIVGSINYYIYGYKKKYLKIIEKYKNEDNKTRKKNRTTVKLFIIFSLLVMVVLFVVSGILYQQKHGITGHF